MSRTRQKERISQLLFVLRVNGHPRLPAEDCPDERDSESGDIDAIAGSFAIEHKTLHGIPGSKHSSALEGSRIKGSDDFLSRMAELEVSTDRKGPITAVYIAWRGGSPFAPERVSSIATFTDRNAAVFRSGHIHRIGLTNLEAHFDAS